MILQTSCYMVEGEGSSEIAHLFISNINQNPNPPSLGRQAINLLFHLLALSGKFFCTLIRQPNVQEFVEFSFGYRYLKSKQVLLKPFQFFFANDKYLAFLSSVT